MKYALLTTSLFLIFSSQNALANKQEKNNPYNNLITHLHHLSEETSAVPELPLLDTPQSVTNINKSNTGSSPELPNLEENTAQTPQDLNPTPSASVAPPPPTIPSQTQENKPLIDFGKLFGKPSPPTSSNDDIDNPPPPSKDGTIQADQNIPSDIVAQEQKRKAYLDSKRQEMTARKKRTQPQHDDRKYLSSIKEEGDLPTPTKRPKISYKTHRPNQYVYRPKYNKVNDHLPSAIYDDQYKQLLFQSIKEGNTHVTKSLLNHFNDINLTDDEGNTLLLYAVMGNNFKSTASLLKAGANPNLKNTQELSPLHVAIQNNRADIVSLLLNNDADPNIRGISGLSPIHTATISNNLDALEILLKRGANPDMVTKKGNTALHIAIKEQNLLAAHMLVNHNADIEKRDFKGLTPLMIASLHNKLQHTSLLLNAGAQITKTTAKGKNAADFARAKGHHRILSRIDSEYIKRSLMAERLHKLRQNKVESTATNDTAPTPDREHPKPFFTIEEKEQMDETNSPLG